MNSKTLLAKRADIVGHLFLRNLPSLVCIYSNRLPAALEIYLIESGVTKEKIEASTTIQTYSVSFEDG